MVVLLAIDSVKAPCGLIKRRTLNDLFAWHAEHTEFPQCRSFDCRITISFAAAHFLTFTLSYVQIHCLTKTAYGHSSFCRAHSSWPPLCSTQQISPPDYYERLHGLNPKAVSYTHLTLPTTPYV